MKTPPATFRGLALLAGLLSLCSLLTPLNATTGSKIIYPSDDRWKGSDGSGGGTPLNIANPTAGTKKEAFLQFEVKKLRFAGPPAGASFPPETYGIVTSAILTLTVTSGSTTGNVQVYAIDNYASASTFTWAARPLARGAALASDVGNTTTLAFDVTDYISGEGRFGFVVKAPTGASLTIAANEAGGTSRPKLTVSYDNGTGNLNGVTPTATELIGRGTLYRSRYGVSTTSIPDPDIVNIGIMDVTAQPYGAKGDNSTDDTLAIQRAVNEARAARLALYFPPGTYVVTDTINIEQNYVPTETINPGETAGTDDDEEWNVRDFPNVIRGDMVTRPTIKLVPAVGDASFDNTALLKPVLYFWSQDGINATSDPARNNLGTNYNHALTHINVDIQTGARSGAVAVSMAGAQGTRIANVVIYLGGSGTGAYAGLGGLPGPGGGIQAVSVYGGRHAVYTTSTSVATALNAQTPLIVGCVFENQTDKSIVYGGNGSLTVVGTRIINSQGISLVGPSPWGGNLSVVDSYLKLRASAGVDDAAISGNRNVYLSNVYVESIAGSLATQQIVNVAGQHARAHVQTGAGARVTKVGDYAGSIAISQYPQVASPVTLVPAWVGTNTGSVTRNSPAGTDHTWEQNVVNFTGTIPPSGDVMFTQHQPDATPNFLTAYNAVTNGGVNPNDLADDRAALQAAIDTSPTNTVFLPAGTYYLSAPLTLKANTKLFGIDKSYVVIKSLWSSTAFNTATEVPLIQTTTATADAPLLADLQLRTRCSAVKDLGAYLLKWQAGKGTVRDVLFDRRKVDTGDGNQNYPAVIITGNGGGNWYNFWITRNFVADGYRHLAIRNTTNKLRFYMLNPEYAKAQPQVEISGAQNIDIFASKSEGNYRNYAITGSSHFRLFGLGGNQAPFESDDDPLYTPAGFDQSVFISGCSDFLVANQSYQIRNGIDTNYSLPEGAKTDPAKFSRVKEVHSTGTTSTPGVEQFVVYRRGTP